MPLKPHSPQRINRGMVALLACLSVCAGVFGNGSAYAACPLELDIPYSPDNPPGPSFGVREMQDQLIAGQQLIQDIYTAFYAGDDVFTIPPGDYRFETVSQKGPNAFALENLNRDGQNQFRILGYGATLWFNLHGNSAPQVNFMVGLFNCCNITLEGLTIDSNPRGQMDARVTAFDFTGNRIQVQPLEGTFLLPSVPVHQNRFIPFKPDGKHIAPLYKIDTAWGPGNMVFNAFTVDPNGRYWLEMDTPKLLQTVQDPTWQATYGSAGTLEIGDVLAVLYSANRGINLDECKQVIIRDLHMYTAKSTRHESGYCDNQWINCRLMGRPGTNNLSGGEGSLSTDCMHGSLVDGMLVHRTSDDTTNLRAMWRNVISTNVHSATFHRRPPLLLEPGHKADFYDISTKQFIATLTVASAYKETVTFVEPVGSAYDNAKALFTEFQNAGWVMRNCFFVDSYQRTLMQCGPGLFEHNRLERVGSCMRIHPGAITYVETGIPSDITIRNNVFIDCSTGPDRPSFEVNSDNRRIENLTITGNIICNSGREVAEINQVDNFNFSNNIIINPFEGSVLLPETHCPDLPIAVLDDVNGATIENNTIIRRTPETGVVCHTNSSNISESGNIQLLDPNEEMETLLRQLTATHTRSAAEVIDAFLAVLHHCEGDLQQAEDGTLDRSAILSNGSGWNGSGYVDLGPNGYVDCTVTVECASEYDLHFNVAGNADGMSAAITVNGNLVAANLACPNTGSWNSAWQVITLSGIALNAGANTIRFASSSASQPNIDQIEVIHPGSVPTSSVPGDCDGDRYVLVNTEGLLAIDCVSGAQLGTYSGCDCADVNLDGDVDMDDFAVIQPVVIDVPPCGEN
jgi:hypothetical protein